MSTSNHYHHLEVSFDGQPSLPNAHAHDLDPVSTSSESESPGHPASPATPHSIDYDVAEVTLPSSKWEFEYTLQRSWEDKSHQQSARLERYQRFGMTEEDARQPTPEPMREAYCLLIDEQLAGDRTPSPPPLASRSRSACKIPSSRSTNHSARVSSQTTPRPRNRPRGKRDSVRKPKPATRDDRATMELIAEHCENKLKELKRKSKRQPARKGQKAGTIPPRHSMRLRKRAARKGATE